MGFVIPSRCFMLLAMVLLLLGCSTASVKEAKGPTISEAQAVPARGPKARIAVAQIVNQSKSMDVLAEHYPATYDAYRAQQRTHELAELGRHSEQMKEMAAYHLQMQAWLADVHRVGRQKAGPPPEPPKNYPGSSPYRMGVPDPVAAGIRDMLTTAFFNSGRYIVLERGAINLINWEQEFSKTPRVGSQTAIPTGQIEGVELLVLGALTAFELKKSGGSAGASILKTIISNLPYVGPVVSGEGSEGEIAWEKAYLAMDLRVVDTRTSRVLAVTTVEGTATKASLGASDTRGTSDAGSLSSSISFFANTPVEVALRKMVDKAVGFVVSKTPEHHYHY